MSDMKGTLLCRTRVARAVAATLAAVMLTLSVSAGFHAGDHDDLGWLPERFHQHDYHWVNEPPGSPLPLVDHCLACHLGRTLVRFGPPRILVPEGPDATVASVVPSDDAAPSRADFPRTSRAPPAS
jgi:hypothetical protein